MNDCRFLRPRSLRPARRGGARGFTLIELMIAVAVLAIVVSLALPSYLDSMRKGRRADAVAALTAVQQAQERWRANQASYTASLTDLGLPSASQGGYYSIGIDAATAGGYVITATPVSGSSQAADSRCTRMRLQLVGGNVFYGGCAACDVPTPPATVTDNNRCWSR